MTEAKKPKFPAEIPRTDNRSVQSNKLINVYKSASADAGWTERSFASGQKFHKTLADILWKVVVCVIPSTFNVSDHLSFICI